MPVIDDVRRIAADLPGSEERETTAGPAWFVRNKAFVWECRAWPSIPAELREIIERELVVGVKVAQSIEADALREMHPDVFLAQTTRWGEPKVAFRMGGIDAEHLEELIIESWRVQAPRYLRRELDVRMGFADS
ncbi:MmcQ/YjbR family DNA-binding protein [Microbacterium gorillae]|uniref:MmcQ/YjbR family DNA-binding protein n=1 Tax=Microbacterium gorillae TaxID=1231063 RepID=UPI003D96B619